MAYRRRVGVALIDLYVRANRKTFCGRKDGRTVETGFIRSTGRSRPRKLPEHATCLFSSSAAA